MGGKKNTDSPSWRVVSIKNKARKGKDEKKLVYIATGDPNGLIGMLRLGALLACVISTLCSSSNGVTKGFSAGFLGKAEPRPILLKAKLDEFTEEGRVPRLGVEP